MPRSAWRRANARWRWARRADSTPMLLGKFLEVSVYAPDVPESLSFYESLGFVQASTGETWSHPYAVVTDGRLFIGLHQNRIASPALTWVLPDVARHAPRLHELGIEFEFAKLDSETFHEVGFLDPSGQMITIIEARTFSPPALAAAYSSDLGYFEEFGIPTNDLERAGAFWDRLGFVTFDPVREPFAKVVAAGRDLNIGLYDLDLRGPVLTFSDPAMAERITRLREQGQPFNDRLPRGMNSHENAILRAPEGTELLLTTG
jgi:catechol 2,3-dioxygenase-like lactoylglutathione lyase family enzyme